MFEFGKTYKTRDGRDALVVVAYDMTESGYIFAIVDRQKIRYTREGRYSFDDSPLDLMPPLQKVIGGIYRDNHGNLRVLVQGVNATELHAMQIYDFTNYSALDNKDWTRGKDFTLVELVFDAAGLRSK